VRNQAKISGGLPGPVTNVSGVIAEIVREIEKAAEYMLGDGLGAIGANVCDHNTVIGSGSQVYIVRACRQQTDEANFRTGLEYAAGQTNLVANYDCSIAGARRDVVGFGVTENLEIGQQGLQFTDIKARTHRIPVKENCFHVDIRSRVSQSTGR
jgi:hypothetical protein